MTAVAVRRLFRKLFSADDDATAAVGAVLDLPVDEAEVLVERGDVAPVYPQAPEPVGPQPLADHIRRSGESDPELRGLLATLRAYCYRGLGPYDQRRYAATLRLHRYTPALAPRIRLDAFTRDGTDDMGPDGWPRASLARLPDPKGAAIAWRLHRRMQRILTDTFDRLRAGTWTATAISPASGCRMPVPIGTWASPGVSLDTGDNTLVAGTVMLFAGVEVQPAAPQPRSAPRSTLDRFVAAFDLEMQALQRRFTLAELVEATRSALSNGISAREVDGALRLASPAAWAGSGRRPACVVPTPDEITEAARRAAETRA